MKLTTTCNKCRQEIKTKTWSNDRVELARTKGEFIELSCMNCNTTDKYHVDRLSTRPSWLAHVFALTILLIVTQLLLFFIWEPICSLTWSYAIIAIVSLLLIPVTLYGLILKDDRTRVSLTGIN
jgi:hypothetical protein